MVDVRMRQQNKVQLGRRNRHRPIDKNVLSLLHAEIHNALLVSDLDQGTAAGDLVRSPVKTKFHPVCLPSVFYVPCFCPYFTREFPLWQLNSR